MDQKELCPICGGELVEKNTETIIRGGNDTAVIQMRALVCTKCGEHIYPIQTIRSMEKIKLQLSRGDVSEFEPLGRSFKFTLKESE